MKYSLTHMHAETARELLDHGADVNATDNDGAHSIDARSIIRRQRIRPCRHRQFTF